MGAAKRVKGMGAVAATGVAGAIGLAGGMALGSYRRTLAVKKALGISAGGDSNGKRRSS